MGRRFENGSVMRIRRKISRAKKYFDFEFLTFAMICMNKLIFPVLLYVELKCHVTFLFLDRKDVLLHGKIGIGCSSLLFTSTGE